MIVKPSLQSHTMRRNDSTVGDEDQVKLTLAVETKDDLLYDISRDANERAQRREMQQRNRSAGALQSSEDDFEDQSQDEPKTGDKRKYKQLEKKFDESSNEEDDQSYDAKKAKSGVTDPSKRVKKGSSQQGADDEQVAQMTEAQRNQAFDSGDEEEYVPGHTIKAAAPVQEGQQQNAVDKVEQK